MAYLAFAADDVHAVAVSGPSIAAPAVAPARFSPLEWSVVALAQRDGLSSLRTPGRVASAVGRLFGTASKTPLADRRLEALRRMAVLTWHHGYQVPVSAIRGFIDSGFSADQYELLAASIGTARSSRSPRAL